MARLDNQILFVPVSGYISEDQQKFTPADMAGLGFEPEDSGWAASAEIGDCRTVDYGNCRCVLIRMK